MHLLDLVTEKDNHTLCPVRVIAILGALEFLALVGYNVLDSKSTDLTSLGTGLAVVVAAVSAAVTGKAALSEKKKEDGK